jgi:hypothetical protein
MKRISLLFLLSCGLLMAGGCSEAKRRAEEVIRGTAEHAANKATEAARDKGTEAVDGGADTGPKKAEKDRQAIKGKDDAEE